MINLAPYKAHFAACQTKELTGHKENIHSVSWSSTGKLATASVDGTARIWNIQSSSPLEQTLKGHSGRVYQVSFDPTNPERVATASSDKTVRIWDLRDGSCSRVIETRGENINLAWSPDATAIAVGTKDDEVFWIDTRTGKMLKSQRFKNEVNEIKWDKSGNIFTIGSGSLELMSYPGLKPLRKIEAHTGLVNCIEYDPTNSFLAAGSTDSLASIWSVPEMICLRTLSFEDFPVRVLSWSHDSMFLAFASESTTIHIVNPQTGELVHQITTRAPVNSIAWHPSEYLLAYAGHDNDKDDGKIVRVFGVSSATTSASGPSSSSAASSTSEGDRPMFLPSSTPPVFFTPQLPASVSKFPKHPSAPYQFGHYSPFGRAHGGGYMAGGYSHNYYSPHGYAAAPPTRPPYNSLRFNTYTSQPPPFG